MPVSAVRTVFALLVAALFTLQIVGCAGNRRGSYTINNSVADGNTVPPDKQGAALCYPNTSGPRQFPLNVGTADAPFYPNPDPSATPVVKIVNTPNAIDPAARTLTITIQGKAVPYPGQHP